MKRLTLSVAVWSLTCSIVLVSIAWPSRASTSPSPAGGTLRLAMLNDAEQNLDPDKEYLPSTWELFRCCLLRTLLSYNGQPSENAGADLFPDLADGMPTVSADGMTWTFHIKHGIHYAPPFSDVEVTAGDFVRALNREADPIASASPGYPVYYKPIVGFDEARTFDEANTPAIATVSGLEIPDRYTFVVRLNEPTGDLGYRFSLPATAPIPPSPVDQSYPDGAAHGLEADYGHHIVSTGPYMLEGSSQLDFSKQPAYLRPGVAGYEPGRAITLVRNPSWDPATDPLRPAYADRIEIRLAPNRFEWSPLGGVPVFQYLAAPELERLTKDVRAGRLDLIFDANARESTIGTNAQSHTAETLRFLSMNLAQPPFDDLHVRKAVNYVINKDPIIAGFDRLGVDGLAANHLAPDSLESGLLANYDPYPPSRSDALREMAESGYDANRDGICDAAACRSVAFQFTSAAPDPTQARLISLVRTDLDRIGIRLADAPFVAAPAAPADHVGLSFGDLSSWQADYPSASPFFTSLFASWQIVDDPNGRSPNPNFSLLGASRDQLKLWGYWRTRSVPSVDDWIHACQPETGQTQAQCSAETDQYLMQEVVPAVPISFDVTVRVVSSRVQNYSIDQFTGLPALDHLAVTA